MPEKLKRIPSDIVSYVQIEGEAIQDANDKMIIASYANSKLELINWYIELLDAGSKKYIVPHSKAHLVDLRDQLKAALQKIMAVKIVSPNQRPLINIKYPEGYEG